VPDVKLLEQMVLPNTLMLPARAAFGVSVTSIADLQAAAARALSSRMALNVLGSGSNVVLPRTLPGLTVLMAIKGINEVAGAGGQRCFDVGAGESWQGFVRFALGQGLGGGIENLSLIPGTVGAAPIQNIGAYGVEVAEFVEAVEVLNIRKPAAGTHWLSAAQCAFGYRDSLFKREPGRWLVTRVRLVLPDGRAAPVRIEYAGLGDELLRMGVTRQTPAVVAEAVSRTRRRKLPDPRLHPNVGSFFKNPVMSQANWHRLQQTMPELSGLPVWSAAAEHASSEAPWVKVAAAALIDQAGCKTLSAPTVRVWYRQPLVLVNRGGADASSVADFAQRIRAGVEQRFGIVLEQEPVAFAS